MRNFVLLAASAALLASVSVPASADCGICQPVPGTPQAREQYDRNQKGIFSAVPRPGVAGQVGASANLPCWTKEYFLDPRCRVPAGYFEGPADGSGDRGNGTDHGGDNGHGNTK